MRYTLIYFLIVLLSITTVTAVSVDYSIKVENSTSSEIIPQTKECDLECIFSLPQPSIENTVTYSISDYNTELIKEIKFLSTDSQSTTTSEDKLIILVKKTSIKILSVVPNLLYPGNNNLIIQIENDGSEELLDLHATISGEGIKTKEFSSLESLSPKKSEFLNILLEVSAQDQVDVIVKIFSASEVIKQEIKTISIKSEKKPVEEKPTEEKQTLNSTDASQKITKVREDLRKYEEEMFNKRADGYDVKNIEGDIEDTKSLIQKVQLEYIRYSQEDFDLNYNLITSNIEDIRLKLNVAQPTKTFGERIKDNIIVISTAVGLIISALTAYGLAKTHVGLNKISPKRKK
ncbi:MAG: hypothetical protein AABW46_01350 [Nanoarchaeota archaeon]